jgi:spore maturation protein CgeB
LDDHGCNLHGCSGVDEYLVVVMRLVIFGLTVTSSWGNGHATVWRSLLRALGAAGHHATFYERNTPYYAAHRDLTAIEGHVVRLYESWNDISTAAAADVQRADAAIVTSYCPDARAAADLVLHSRAGVRAFYDLDTPLTLERLRSGLSVDYLPSTDLSAFDLVLSFGGGRALDELRARLRAKRVAPLYASVDPDLYKRTEAAQVFQADLAYLGTYSDDRQAALEALFLEPARQRPSLKFLIGGSLYPADFPWSSNLYYVRHVAPPDHPSFYSSCRLTVNVTRAPMAAMGFCPSGRLFEAASCGTPVLSDTWPGLEEFFEPDREILTASNPGEVLDALDRSPESLADIGARARARVLEYHSGERRARELEQLIADR